MNIDQDLEVVHPWFYSTYLIDDNILVSFAPGEKSAIYKMEFPDTVTKNLLIRGSDKLEGNFDKPGTFSFRDTAGETTEGLNPVRMVVTAYVYGELSDNDNNLIKDASIKVRSGKCTISLSKGAPKTVLIRYAVSYISPDQAKINFDKELAKTIF